MDLAEMFRANEKLIAERKKRARQETNKQRELRHQAVCIRCRYARTTKSMGRDYFVSCDYILMTKRMRPCAGADCLRKGVFESGEMDGLYPCEGEPRETAGGGR